MILAFSTKINGKETFFVEKIATKQKTHTIREDKNNRWQAGVKIDFFINPRTKNMFRFAPVLPVVSIQFISIKPAIKEVCIDGHYLSSSEKVQVAQNDGFDTIEDFFAYFNTDFVGKIIHWTDLRY